MMNYKNISTPKELLDYMSNNIKYGFVDENGMIYNNPDSNDWKENWYDKCIVQDGLGLLNTKYGICWDQVELERKWFEENKYKYKTLFLWFDIYNSDLPTHTFLIYEYETKFYWFENSFEKYRGIHSFNSEKELIDDVKNKQLEYAISINKAIPEYYQYLKYYEYSKPIKNIHVYEYIKHVTSQK